MKSIYLLFIAALLALALLLGCAKPTTPATSTENNPNAAGAGSEGATAAGKTSAGKPAPEGVTIPAGTVVVVRLGETLSSNKSEAGQGFSATVARPIVVAGKTVIEQGASARGTVVDAKAMGHFKGGALLEIRLNSVTINGRERNVRTAAVERELKGKGKRSAGFIGGGAGAAGAAFTGNKEIVMPAESLVSFKLTKPVEVK